eukprot:TRINITY_DN2333_c0_g1_i1.p1 TRINITY_DN2333_c0_g1~~TRINITY_DN2333_c0_g1_i1.p1  ORF type:complete len:243 (+),score=59.50 TRINITY_DN2333_c0_g1_i1:56-730(+)
MAISTRFVTLAVALLCAAAVAEAILCNQPAGILDYEDYEEIAWDKAPTFNNAVQKAGNYKKSGQGWTYFNYRTDSAQDFTEPCVNVGGPYASPSGITLKIKMPDNGLYTTNVGKIMVTYGKDAADPYVCSGEIKLKETTTDPDCRGEFCTYKIWFTDGDCWGSSANGMHHLQYYVKLKDTHNHVTFKEARLMSEYVCPVICTISNQVCEITPICDGICDCDAYA